MAKRFSETEKWNDEWFCELKPLQKLVFLFIVDRCDNAGFMEINTRVNCFLIGITPEQYEGAIKGLNKCIIKSNDGKKLWVVNFLKHQKNLPLKFENNAHKQIIYLIQQNAKLFEYDFEKLGAKQGLISPIGKGIGKGKEGGVGGTENLIPGTWEYEKKSFLNNEGWQIKFCTEKRIEPIALKTLMQDFICDIELKTDFKEANELRRHFTNTFNLLKRSEVKTQIRTPEKQSAPELRTADYYLK
jgi:hypothetical protein